MALCDEQIMRKQIVHVPNAIYAPIILLMATMDIQKYSNAMTPFPPRVLLTLIEFSIYYITAIHHITFAKNVLCVY